MLKKIIWLTFILLLILVVGCYIWIKIQTKDKLYSNINEIPVKKVGLLLGTGKNLRNGYINLYFLYRIDAAVRLYKAGKIQHIIASGDNRTIYHNEPIDMMNSLIERGIPKKDITLDYAGFRTLDSVIRCKKIFSQDDIIVISQKFHNERAIFISDYYDIKAIGFNAEDIPFKYNMKTPLREYLARFKAILDLYILKTKPKFLGEKVQIKLP
ncbi:MAG: YdcF family protein [Thiomargarita sp.]|nr:YdcF family protein [Thiomargarita sp.]